MAITTRKAATKKAPTRKAGPPRNAKASQDRTASKKPGAKAAPRKRPAKQVPARTTVTRTVKAVKQTAQRPKTDIVSSRRLVKTAGGSSQSSTKANELRAVLEVGPRAKKLAAVAPNWPGLERGARTPEAATAALLAYLPRYAKVAKLAGLGAEFAALTTVEVVEEYEGTGSTDFWGISFAFSSFDGHDISSEQLDRELALMRACWSYFDEVRARVSAEMQKGPRGGGRDRDRIVRHTLGVEQDWARKLGLQTPQDVVITDPKGLKAFRDAYCRAIRSFHSEGKLARTWPLRYLIRHTAYHTLDHAWEMEDKDMSDRGAKGAVAI